MLKQVDKINYRVVRPLGILKEDGSETKEINLVSWNDHKPVIDIRNWKTLGENKIALRGLTLTTEETRKLKENIDNYLIHVDELLAEKEVKEK